MDIPVELIKDLNAPNLIAMAAMFWFMYSRLDKKLEKIDQKFEKIDQRFEKIDHRFDRVDHRFQSIEKDIFNIKNEMIGIKTILHMKECCMLRDDRQMKKAE